LDGRCSCVDYIGLHIRKQRGESFRYGSFPNGSLDDGPFAANPKFPIGEQAEITAGDDHRPGMKGAVANIAGAFQTNVYAVTYTPTTGGSPVKNHKWVIQEEIQNAGNEAFQVGDEVILEADHMKGMKGATATIESVQFTNVYMIDFQTTDTGDEVKNHKWVIEDELTVRQFK
jgi:hypothetical protein